MSNEASIEMIDQSSNFSMDAKIEVDHDIDGDDEVTDSANEMESSDSMFTIEAEDDDSNYMVGKEVLSYRRIQADLKASRRLRKKHQAKLKTMKAWSNLSSSVTPSKSSSSSSSSTASTLSSTVPVSSSQQHLSSLSLPLSIIEQNSWTILTDLSVLKSNGYRGQYYRKKLQLPLPVKFRTPRYSRMKSTFLLMIYIQQYRSIIIIFSYHT